MKWTAGSTSRSPRVIVCLSSVFDDLIMELVPPEMCRVSGRAFGMGVQPLLP
jgi:hypothetical protein